MSARFIIFSCAAGLVIGSLKTCFSLQSSVEVKANVGLLSLGLYNVIAVASAILVYPFTLRLIGRKYSLILGDISCVVFGLTFLISSDVVTIASNAFLGAFEALLFSAAYAIAATMEVRETDANGDGKRNAGYFIAIIGIGQSLMNILPAVTLEQSRPNSSQSVDDRILNTTCGSRDCPSSYTHETRDPLFGKLLPTATSLYLFVGIITSLQIASLVAHILCLRNDRVAGTASEGSPLIEGNDSGDKEDCVCLNQSIRSHFRASLISIRKSFLTAESFYSFPSQVYFGLITGFLWSEFTRSYASCTLGVQNVGWAMFAANFASAVTAAVITRFGRALSARSLTVTRSFFDVVVCTSLLVWKPSSGYLYVAYILAVLLGIAHGFSKILAYTLPVTHFRDIDAAYTLCFCWDAVGIAIAQLVSIWFCTGHVIWMLLGFSIFSSVVLFVGDLTAGKESACRIP